MITKETAKIANGYVKTFSTRIFWIVKVIQPVPQPVYELCDLRDSPNEGLFYNYGIVKVTVSPRTEFQIDKIVRTRNKNGI